VGGSTTPQVRTQPTDQVNLFLAPDGEKSSFSAAKQVVLRSDF
jgi:hypothetical protein